MKKFFSIRSNVGIIFLFFSMNLFNLFNFVFHFIMGRMLGPIDYGVLATLMSLVYIYSIPTEAIQNIISRYSTKFSHEGGKITRLLSIAYRKGVILSLILFILFVPISLILSEFLQINFYLILLANILLVNSILSPISKGVLQGTKRFGRWSIAILMEGFFKITIPFLLVLFGGKVFGAIIGTIIAIFIGLILSIIFIWDYFWLKKERLDLRNIYRESASYFSVVLSMFIIFSSDIILAQRFFSPEISGKYAVLSILGKISFFGTGAITKIIFPLSSEKYDQGLNSRPILIKSLIITIILSLIVIIFYILIPEKIIALLYGVDYVSISRLIYISAISFSLLSMTNIVLNYGLSTRKIEKNHIFILLFIPINLIFLYLFNQNVSNYIFGIMLSNIIIFIGSIISIKIWKR